MIETEVLIESLNNVTENLFNKGKLKRIKVNWMSQQKKNAEEGLSLSGFI